MMENDKILLTGVCYVHRLLQLRFDKQDQINKTNYIKAVHPNFDVNNIKFFHEGIEDKFLFTDFHGKFSSIQTEASDLYNLLELYEDKCRVMYMVGATYIANIDMAQILSPKDYAKLSVFWYFLFNQDWNPHKVTDWANQRDKALLKLFQRFPNLKMIVYQLGCKRWWEKVGLPKDRMIYWEIDWGMSRDDFEAIRQDLIAKGLAGAHRFPVEESYNELCDMILKDYEGKRVG